MPTAARKSVQVKVSLTPELHEGLRLVAAELGQAPATLASVAIGQYVAQQRRTISAFQHVASQMADKMADEGLRQMRLEESKS